LSTVDPSGTHRVTGAFRPPRLAATRSAARLSTEERAPLRVAANLKPERTGFVRIRASPSHIQ
jgi:hypothetical protein